MENNAAKNFFVGNDAHWQDIYEGNEIANSLEFGSTDYYD